MATFVLIHGSWHTGEAWARVKPLLEATGAVVHAPSLTGMTSRDGPGGPDVSLETHIGDIVRLIRAEELSNVTLVGHSYSGLVATAVADRIPERIARIVYLDAFIPENGQSLFDIMGLESEQEMKAGLVDSEGRTMSDGAEHVWLLAPGDASFYLGDDAEPADIAWLQDRLVYKPVATFSEKVRLDNVEAVRAIRSLHIECTGFPYLAWVAEKARGLGWPVVQIESGHDAMITHPQEVAEALLTF